MDYRMLYYVLGRMEFFLMMMSTTDAFDFRILLNSWTLKSDTDSRLFEAACETILDSVFARTI